MRPTHVLIAAILGASGGAIFVVFLWVFFGPQRLGIPALTLPWSLLAGALVGGLFAGLTTWRSLVLYERRLEANQEFAARLNMRFTEKPPDVDWPTSLANGVHHGTHDAWLHCWQGTYAGLAIDVVDVRFTVRSSSSDGPDTTRTHEQTVYAWNVEELRLPSFSISGRGWGTAVLTALLGSARIVSFDANALSDRHSPIVREFNRRFLVHVTQSSDNELAVRRLCVPEVMQALLGLGKVRLLSDHGRLAVWWPDVVSSGAQRQERLEQTLRLVKALRAANEDRKAELVPANPNAHTDAMWSALPMGCALALAIPGFFLGGIGAAIVAFQGRRPPMFLFPLSAFGLLLAFGAIGWMAGYAINRCRGGV